MVPALGAHAAQGHGVMAVEYRALVGPQAIVDHGMGVVGGESPNRRNARVRIYVRNRQRCAPSGTQRSARA
jgi:hypothetical protein